MAYSDLEGQKQELLEAFIYDKRIDKDTYDPENQRIQNSLRDLVGQRLAHASVPTDIQRLLEHAAGLIADLSGYWNHLNVTDRPRYVRAMFPGGLSFDGEAIGTGEMPWILWPSPMMHQSKEGLAVPTGFEPAFPA